MVISVDRYDRYLHHAESVSWSYRVPLSPGWTPVPTADLSARTGAEARVDGRLVRVTVAATVVGDQVQVTGARLTVDGEPTTPSAAPPAVRAAVEPVLAPSTFATPMPGVGAYVRGVRVEEAGIEVDVEAVQVDADAGGTGR